MRKKNIANTAIILFVVFELGFIARLMYGMSQSNIWQKRADAVICEAKEKVANGDYRGIRELRLKYNAYMDSASSCLMFRGSPVYVSLDSIGKNIQCK